MKRAGRDYLRAAPDDGRDAPTVGRWAEEKYRRLGLYAEIFSTGMKRIWDQRVYLDLYAGSGHAVIRATSRRVLTSPLIALTVRDPFDQYVFCEADASKLDCLGARAAGLAPHARVVLVPGDVNAQAEAIAAHIPAHSTLNRVLSFCFVDPFDLGIHFETIRALGATRAMDFLVLLALGMDATRNWATYLGVENRKVDLFLGDNMWRERWHSAEAEGKSPIRFLAEEYGAAMSRLGYLARGLESMQEVRTPDNNMRLYYLAFFSKHERGYEFWDQANRYASDQLDLDL